MTIIFNCINQLYEKIRLLNSFLTRSDGTR